MWACAALNEARPALGASGGRHGITSFGDCLHMCTTNEFGRRQTAREIWSFESCGDFFVGAVVCARGKTVNAPAQKSHESRHGDPPARAHHPSQGLSTGVRSPHSFREHFPVNRPARGVTCVTCCRRRPDATFPGPAPHRNGPASWRSHQLASTSPGPPPIVLRSTCPGRSTELALCQRRLQPVREGPAAPANSSRRRALRPFHLDISGGLDLKNQEKMVLATSYANWLYFPSCDRQAQSRRR